MRDFLLVVLVFLLGAVPFMAAADQEPPRSDSMACKGMTQEATKLARQLFQQKRPQDKLSDYAISRKTKGSEIVVSFTRKSSIRLGDHPFVIFDCEKKTAQYFEGE